MIVRLPSNQRSFDLVWSGDSAFVQIPVPADDATPEQIAEYEKAMTAHREKWKIARETGDYSALRVEGASEPTVFACKPLTADQMALFFDLSRQVGVGEATAVAFLCALKSVSNLGDVEVTRTIHPKFGDIASSSFLDKAGVPPGTSLSITLELGQLVVDKGRSLPKA